MWNSTVLVGSWPNRRPKPFPYRRTDSVREIEGHAHFPLVDHNTLALLNGTLDRILFSLRCYALHWRQTRLNNDGSTSSKYSRAFKHVSIVSQSHAPHIRRENAKTSQRSHYPGYDYTTSAYCMLHGCDTTYDHGRG
ncbi:uncharacterized protein SETTUDRAFT_32889 [Exserohilum turcica Et28A]|uniref:Uncharacterized protein n=1 Tax=Exserohilum turcicum (strain 28A) TaxID=671987 RepID=R0K6B8_EXST2|nr:uncharacterized protein SETTUDRAFT_32889 [Exserohilum turcica Et28A]EOA83872.1 hypothetical protein SETTUDRAFT_32889 [Exserohilum turcica Et28A]